MSKFLIMRGRARPGDQADAQQVLRSILVFDDEDPGAQASYERAESLGVECVLVGADNLAGVAETHPDWLDVPPDFEGLVAA